VCGRREGFDPDAFAFEIGNAAYLLVSEHLKAADMHRTQNGYRDTLLEPSDQHRGKIRSEISVAAGDALQRGIACRHVADIGKALGTQQFLGDILGSDTDAGDFRQPHRVCFECSFRRHSRRAQQRRGTDPGKPGEKAASRLRPRHCGPHV
jgi:hypothetical protein